MRKQIENKLVQLERMIPIEVSIAGMVVCSIILGFIIGFLYAIHGN